MNKYKETYDKRWEKSINTSDDDILTFDNPKTQVEFFYNEYNKLIAGKVKSLYGICSDKSLLEIGCGRATASIYLNKNLGINITVSDYSDVALDIAKKNMKKYKIKGKRVKADLYNLPFEKDSYDVIISLGVMEHIDNPLSAYKEMKRVLNPGGLMISMNVPEHPDNIQRIAIKINQLLLRVESFFYREPSKPWLDKTQSKTDNIYRSEWNGDDFKKTVLDAGFENIEVIECNVFPTLSPVTGAIDRTIVLFYKLILKYRRLVYKGKDPFECSKKNSRVHFIVAT